MLSPRESSDNLIYETKRYFFMVAIGTAQFLGTNGTSIPAGTPFYLNLIMRNTSVLDQEYIIKVIYSDGDPTANGTKIASVVATLPSAAVGGSQRVTIPLNVSAPEGTRLKLYAIAYPRCPSKRMPALDCTNVVYPVGTLTVTRAAGQVGMFGVRPYGVAYPGRVWTGESLPSGMAFGMENGVYVSTPPGGMYKGGTNYNPPECNVKFKIPDSPAEYQRLLSRAQQGMSDAKSLAEGGPEVGLIFPQEMESWSYCASGRDPIGTVIQERWVTDIYNAARSWWERNHIVAPPSCVCDPPNCFKKGDASPQNVKKSHKDVCGNTVVDEWCPPCDPSKCFAQKPQNVKSYTRDECGNYVVTEWCDPNCPKSPTDKIIQERFPGSQILDFTRDTCGCVIPRIRQLSKPEIEKLNIEKAKAKGGRVVLAKRTVVIPQGFAMAIDQYGVLPIFASRRRP